MALPLKEVAKVRQVPGERPRRWFTSADIDLIVWFNEFNVPVGFQLCYDKGFRERALTMSADGSISHSIVDDGENPSARYKETPVLGAAATLDGERILATFSAVSASLPVSISEFVFAALIKLSG